MSKTKGRRQRNGDKTFGRNKPWCESYRRRGQREKNKVKKVAAHRRRHPNDRG